VKRNGKRNPTFRTNGGTCSADQYYKRKKKRVGSGGLWEKEGKKAEGYSIKLGKVFKKVQGFVTNMPADLGGVGGEREDHPITFSEKLDV